MLNEIDLFVIGFLLFALWDGWRVGLFRSILNPLCFLFFLVIAIINFDLNSNIAVATLIVVIGTAAVSTTIRVLLWLSRRTVETEFRQYIFWASRLCGAAISLFWKSFVGVIVLLTITLLPTGFLPGVADTQKGILFSRTFAYTEQHILNRFPQTQRVYLVFSVLKDAAQNQVLSQKPEFRSFFHAEKIQNFINDGAVQEQLATRDYVRLLANPKLQIIITDDELMANLVHLSRQIYKEKFKNGAERKEATTAAPSSLPNK